MPLINRMTRLFRADFHAVLDRIEEPDLMLAQAIREMEAVLAEATRRLDALTRQHAALLRRRGEIATTVAGIAEQLELCFDAGNQDLARLLLRRRLEGERLDAQLEREAGRIAAERERLQREADGQGQQLGRLQQQAALHLQRADAPGATPAPWSAEDIAVSDADVELALLREQRRRA